MFINCVGCIFKTPFYLQFKQLKKFWSILIILNLAMKKAAHWELFFNCKVNYYGIKRTLLISQFVLISP